MPKIENFSIKNENANAVIVDGPQGQTIIQPGETKTFVKHGDYIVTKSDNGTYFKLQFPSAVALAKEMGSIDGDFAVTTKIV
jgi:hypothetical protein